MTDKSVLMTDSEQAVVHCITMRLNIRQALQFLKHEGFDMCERTYCRHKKKVESMKLDRLVHTANLFTEQHLQRLDKLELVEELMWRNYHDEKSPSKRVGILQAIVSMQPYLSNYYGATTFVLARRLKTDVIQAEQVEGLNKEEQDSLRDMTPLSGSLQQ
jgi:hypothetical protein